MTRILAFGWNEHLTLAVLRCLGLAGHRPVVLAPRHLGAARFSRYCTGYVAHRFPATETSLLKGELDLVCERHRIELVVPTDAEAARVLSEWSPPRNVKVFPVPTAAQIDLCTDKWAFAQRCVADHLAVPSTVRCETPDAFRALRFDRPLFVKPVVGANSEGAARVETAAEADAYLAREPWRPLLVQEFIPGDDVDVSVLCERGAVVAWTAQRLGPTSTSRIMRRETKALELVSRLMKALAWHGVAHVDCREDARDGSIKIFELNPRFWVSLLFSTWAGVNFAELGVEMALGRPVQRPEMREGLYERPLLRPKTVVGAVRHFGDWSDPTWTTWSDPLPQAWLRVERVIRAVAMI